MPDQKYLYKRNQVYYARFRLPKKYGGGYFFKSLKTTNLPQARALRDLLVMPFLSRESLIDTAASLLRITHQGQSAQYKAFRDLTDPSFPLPPPTTENQRLTLAEIAEKYLAFNQSSDLTIGSTHKYRSIIDGFLAIVGGEKFVEEIGKQEIVNYRDALAALPSNWMTRKVGGKTTRTVSVSHIQQSLMVLKRFFAWTINEGYTEIIENPASNITLPYVRRKVRKAFSRGEADEACNLSFPKNQKLVDETAWRLIPLIGRFSGLRLGEICQLCVEDLVVVDGVRCFRIVEDALLGKTTKSHRDHLVPIHSKLEKELDRLVGGRLEGSLFEQVGTYTDGNGVTKYGKGFGNHFNRRVKVIGDYSFHSFRHYAISEMANAGVAEEIRMRVVGHRLKSVHQAYTHLGMAVLKAAVERIG